MEPVSCLCLVSREVRRLAGLGPRASLQKGAAQQRSLGVERERDGTGSDFAGAIGHFNGHLKDIGKDSARDRATGVGVLLMLGNGAVQA